MPTSTLSASADDVDVALAMVEAQRDRLLVRLAAQRTHAALLWAWYHGEQPPPVVQSRYRDGYSLFLGIARTPWARLVVDTIAERLHVTGFRSKDVDVEREAWSTFEASHLNADEWLVYTEALIVGVGYVSVDGATIAPESVFEVTHEPMLGNRRTVGAALKLYPLEWSGKTWALELYRPEATYRWVAELARPRTDGDLTVFPIDEAKSAASLVWEAEDSTPNPRGSVPVVPFENRATVLGGGVSELEDCLPILRRIDKLTLDKLLTSEFGAFRQKWATGLEVPNDPDTGKPVEPFKVAVDRLWIAKGEAGKDARFGSFDATDLSPYLKAIDAEIAALAAISRVPSHYLLQSELANPPSAESLIASESGLVAKVEQRQSRFGESWEAVLALALEGDVGVETIWKDAEMRNPAQVADAAVKLSSIGVPERALWEYIGATPQQIDSWAIDKAATDLLNAASAVA